MIFTLSRLLLPLPVPNHARVMEVDPPPPVVSVELAARGLGSARCVEIPPQTWDNIVEETSLSAMAGVQLPKTDLSPVVRAMTQALHEQGHVVRIERGMPGWGSKPSAPVFVIRKSDVKCSFILYKIRRAIDGIPTHSRLCDSLICGPYVGDCFFGGVPGMPRILIFMLVPSILATVSLL